MLPPTFHKLSALRDCNLKRCTGLTELPSRLGELCSLELLIVQDCTELTSLPASIGSLTSLRLLVLPGADHPLIRSLPTSLHELPDLRITVGNPPGTTVLLGPATASPAEGKPPADVCLGELSHVPAPDQQEAAHWRAPQQTPRPEEDEAEDTVGGYPVPARSWQGRMRSGAALAARMGRKLGHAFGSCGSGCEAAL